jgi:hypothetical protein
MKREEILCVEDRMWTTRYTQWPPVARGRNYEFHGRKCANTQKTARHYCASSWNINVNFFQSLIAPQEYHHSSSFMIAFEF